MSGGEFFCMHLFFRGLLQFVHANEIARLDKMAVNF